MTVWPVENVGIDHYSLYAQVYKPIHTSYNDLTSPTLFTVNGKRSLRSPVETLISMAPMYFASANEVAEVM